MKRIGYWPIFMGLLLLPCRLAGGQPPGGEPAPPQPLSEVQLSLPPADGDKDDMDAEASGMARIEDPANLAPGWTIGFWVILDEPPLERAIARLGRRAKTSGKKQGWEVERVAARVGPELAGATGDGEAMARRGDWVYIFGSHFGKKIGPLDDYRQFVARFRDRAAPPPPPTRRELRNPPELTLEGTTDHFLLHRIINDAFRQRHLELIPRGPGEFDNYIRKTTRKKGDEARLVLADDRAINIEGAAFLDSGVLLLGLRYPVTAQGHPILVALRDIDLLFSGGRPTVDDIWILSNVGDTAQPTGIRDLLRRDSRIDVLTGNLDRLSNKERESALLADHPEGGVALSTHYRFDWPAAAGTETRREIQATVVRPLAPLHNAEGLAADPQGNFYYLCDQKRVHLLYESGLERRVEPVR